MIIEHVVETPVTVDKLVLFSSSSSSSSSFIELELELLDNTQQETLSEFTIHGHISSHSLKTVGFFLSLVKREVPKAWKRARLARRLFTVSL